MKSNLRAKESLESDVTARIGEGKRRTRKPARSTIASADTEQSKNSGHASAPNSDITGTKERRSTRRTAEHKKQTVTQTRRKASSARSL